LSSLSSSPLLILLIGLPGSGKSTLARSFLTTEPTGCLISTDAIRSQLYGDEAIQGSWLKVWLNVCQQFQSAVEQASQGRSPYAIYDATNAVRKQRRQTIATARKAGFTSITGIWLNVPLPICLDRNRSRDRHVPEDVILRMYRRLYGAPPSLEEGLDGLVELYF
jgi:predicted kinase